MASRVRMVSAGLGVVVGLAVVAGACSPSGRDAPPQGGTEGAPAGVASTSTALVTLGPSSGSSSTAPAAATTPSVAPMEATTAAATVAPRPPSPPSTVATAILRSAAAVEPVARVPLTPGAEVVVHPASTFELELSARAADARLVLVDARDDLVPASGTREVGAGTRLTLSPSAPLVPGSRYVLRLDGASDRALHDDAGRAYSAISLPLLAAGAPPPPEPKKPARKKRRH